MPAFLVALLPAGLKAWAETMGWIKQKDAQLNAPVIQQNTTAQEITKAHNESVNQVNAELEQARREQQHEKK